MKDCAASVVDATPNSNYAKGNLVFHVAIEGCRTGRVSFETWVYFTDGQKHEIRLGDEIRGRSSFDVKYALNKAIKAIEEPEETRIVCTCLD